MKIYNTLNRKKEEFKTIKENEVSIYACGPTVYNLIHIGNARPICVFDALRRYLEYKGNKVIFVQNFTDIDDKIIKRANEENVESNIISEKYINEYNNDAKNLNVKPASFHPKVTDNMENIFEIIKTLIEKDYAYISNGDVYFRTVKFKDYGKLSNMPLDELEAGARVDLNDNKENSMDFVLWKSAKKGEPFWESPWGNGRPGWHIECSAMVYSIFGGTIDIHCGGQDLIFPHHENEIAQTECSTDKILANYWMHNGYINVDNKKMSKSLNNFFTVRDIGEKFGYEPIRYMMLQSHYRSPINYSIEVINSCISSLERLYNFRKNLEFIIEKSENNITIKDKSNIDIRKEQFINSMEDDLNTADAISAIFELVRDINTYIADNNQHNKLYLEYALKVFNELIDILGLLYNGNDNQIPQYIYELVEKRNIARKEKNYKLADELRDEINSKGYILEETKQGTKISFKN